MSQADNYAVPDNLLARISIHGYAVRPNWVGWLFDHEMPSQDRPVRILDIGCGPGGLWSGNRDRIFSEWEITLLDSSLAMLELARTEVGDHVRYVVGDVAALPFEDESFDVIVANHMLYHVEDRSRAFGEIKRVLAGGGAFHCSANGRGHLAQVAALRPPHPLNLERFNEAFGLESGPPQLQPFFSRVVVKRFDNRLAVPTAEPVLAYIRSSEHYRDGDDLTAVRAAIEAELQRTGVFSITTKPGVISCTDG